MIVMEARHLTVPNHWCLLSVAALLSSALAVVDGSCASGQPTSSKASSELESRGTATATSHQGRSTGFELRETRSTAQTTTENKRNPVERTAVASPDGSNTVERVPTLPFPFVSSDAVGALSGVQSGSARSFPSAIEIRGNARGLLLHARKDTKYDLLSPVSLWLESGPLLVAVRTPSELALIATKFGDVCVTAGADALLERGEGTLRIANLSNAHGTVNLVMHDRQWKNSPWSHIEQVKELSRKSSKSKKRSEESAESGSLSLAPGYELVVGDHSLEVTEIKPADSVGRRDFKVIGDSGRFVISEICVDNVVQVHDLVRNLKEHGERANNILSEINRVAGQFKAKQGEEGFEKVLPVVKPPETVKKPDPKTKTSPKAPLATVSPKKTSVESKQTPPVKPGATATTGSAPSASGTNSGGNGSSQRTGTTSTQKEPVTSSVPSPKGGAAQTVGREAVPSGRSSVATEPQSTPETK